MAVLKFDSGFHVSVSAANEIAGDSERINGLLDVLQLSEVGNAAETAAHATAGDSEGIIGLLVSESSFRMPNSSGCVDAVACARMPAVPGVSATASSSASAPASLAVVAHACSTPMHAAHNSWSDTGRVQGPTGRRRPKRWGFRSGRRSQNIRSVLHCFVLQFQCKKCTAPRCSQT